MKKWIFALLAAALLTGIATIWLTPTQYDEDDREEESPPQPSGEFRNTRHPSRPVPRNPSPEVVPADKGELSGSPTEEDDATATNLSDLSPEKLRELRTYFEKVNREWRKAVKDLIIKDFSMSREEYLTYTKVREEYEQRKARSFFEFYESLGSKKEDLSKNATEYEEEIGRHLREEYRNRLRGHFGEHNFETYLRLLSSYNERIQREGKPIQGLAGIDL